jgi:hypothetical protein
VGGGRGDGDRRQLLGQFRGGRTKKERKEIREGRKKRWRREMEGGKSGKKIAAAKGL